MSLTLGQAARMAGKGKTTLTRAIKAGKLSASRRDDGSYAIDPAELARVYDVTPETGTATVSDTVTAVHHATPQRDSGATGVPEAEPKGARELIRMLETQLVELRKDRDTQISDLREDRDQWRETANSAQRLLTSMTPEKFTTANRRWWQRRAG